MFEEEAPSDLQGFVGGCLDRLGWAYDWSSDHETFNAVCPDESGPLEVKVRWNDHYIFLHVPRLAEVPKSGRLAALQHVMSLHWDTCLPKFEWDKRDGELRAAWCFSREGGPPSVEQFVQTATAFARAVISARPGLIDAVSRSRRSLSGEPADRVTEAAELSNLGRDLVDLADKREILPMYVREDLVESMISALGGPRQQILLLGESGTGKNAIVQALATWIANGDRRVERGKLGSRHIYECVPASFQSSCIYSHELENKIQLVAGNCISENAIIFLDEVHLATTAGRLDETLNRTIANLLLPFIARNEITMIAATDSAGFKHMLKLNPRFAHSFHIVEVPEPTAEQALLMVQDRMDKFAEGLIATISHTFEPGVDARLVELSGRFLRSQRYPGKALQLLDEVVAFKSEEAGAAEVRQRDVEGAVCRLSGLRPEIVRSEVALTRDEVEATLGAEVIGQDAAVRAVSDVVLKYKAELSPTDRPLGTMLFAGPTGVGKTRLARSLAHYLFGSEEALLRYDMSEYADPSGFTKLCGHRGGGDEPGRLAMDVQASPFSVILFDEIEKAHPAVFDMLLQVLGEGRLTDETGKTASFLNSIIIMTSNLGSHLYRRSQVGFGGDHPVSERQLRQELEKGFRPEFFNRISHMVHFQPLAEAVVREIALREVQALSQRAGLRKRNLHLDASESLLNELMRRGYDALYGARAMQRAVENILTVPLAERIATQSGLKDVCLQLDWGEEGLVVRPREEG